MYKIIFRALNLNQQKCFHLSSKMPKNKKNTSEEKSKTFSEKSAPSNNDTKGAVYLRNDNEIIIKIHAKPGAKESAITDIGNEAVGVQIGAPPVDGEANKELLRYLAEILKLRKSDLNLVKSSRSREKTVVISKDVSLNTILEALNAAIKDFCYPGRCIVPWHGTGLCTGGTMKLKEDPRQFTKFEIRQGFFVNRFKTRKTEMNLVKILFVKEIWSPKLSVK